jgi:hypothetical protein
LRLLDAYSFAARNSERRINLNRTHRRRREGWSKSRKYRRRSTQHDRLLNAGSAAT